MGGAARAGELEERRAAVAGVGPRFDEPVPEQQVHLLLDRLSTETQGTGDGRDRRFASDADTSEHLPARARQPERGDDRVLARDESDVQAGDRQRQRRQRLGTFAKGVGTNDNWLSVWSSDNQLSTVL